MNTITYNVKEVINSNNTTEYRVYNQSITRKKDNTQEDEKTNTKSIGRQSKIDDKEYTSRKDNTARAVRLIYDCCNNNDFDTFITLTYKGNVQDLSITNKHFKSWITIVRRKYPEFAYVGVPEYQKRGAVHYHLLTNIKIDQTDLIVKQPSKKYKNLYDVKYWKHGFTSVFDVKNDVDENFKLDKYLTKYLFKDLDNRYFGHTMVLKSNNLNKPLVKYSNHIKSDSEHILKDIIDYEREIKKGNMTNFYSHKPTNSKAIPFTTMTFANKNISQKDD